LHGDKIAIKLTKGHTMSTTTQLANDVLALAKHQLSAHQRETLTLVPTDTKTEAEIVRRLTECSDCE
jgi:hypothetical protein